MSVLARHNPYKGTFSNGRWAVHLDYNPLPENLNTYHPLDRERIADVMRRIAQ